MGNNNSNANRNNNNYNSFQSGGSKKVQLSTNNETVTFEKENKCVYTQKWMDPQDHNVFQYELQMDHVSEGGAEMGIGLISTDTIKKDLFLGELPKGDGIIYSYWSQGFEALNGHSHKWTNRPQGCHKSRQAVPKGFVTDDKIEITLNYQQGTILFDVKRVIDVPDMCDQIITTNHTVQFNGIDVTKAYKLIIISGGNGDKVTITDFN